MNGCIYRTKYGECNIPNRGTEYGPMCRSDCTDKHPSNADRIRAKSDEGLAYALTWANTIIPPWCAEHIDCPYLDEDPAPCYKCALEWLKQEAVERAEKVEKRHDVGIVPYEEDGRAAEHGDSYGENRNDQDADIGEHIKCAEDFCEIRWSDED